MMLSIVQYLVWLFEFIIVIVGVAMFYFHLPFYLKNILIYVIFRTALLEQLSRLPHVPSVPFQTTPPITQVPEEVGGLYWISQYHLFTISLCFDLTGGLVGCRRKRTWIKGQNLAYGMVMSMTLILMKTRSLDILSQIWRRGKALFLIISDLEDVIFSFFFFGFWNYDPIWNTSMIWSFK